ncbi:hypothetical protein EJ08DRAFT_692393 [Tothia fuscella]|uniref:PSP1 C-terminal domain-containing protein n=1 Tax=Tothia fuscella TaxID=1048955 RepID=A0A9P4P0A0_9PEZI|nr:hypothetical protein EJ08DRAFT_692393 [Tothia fuscella]
MASAASGMGPHHVQNGPNGRSVLTNPAVLEKKAIGSVRRSTPDSEALTSSDDDHEHSHGMSLSLHSVQSLPSQAPSHNPPQGPARRPSWLSEVASSTKVRKYSLGGASYASSGSQPTTPSAENGPWDGGASIVRSGASGSSYPWTPGAQIWKQSRLAEVMPSPGSGSAHEDMRSPTFQNQMANPIPFEIPLEPTRKTVRSQSYSAGQLENMNNFDGSAHPGYPRTKPGGGLMHRPSRPSMLGDGVRDTLASLREDDDDLESLNESEHAFQAQTAASRQGGARGMAPMARASATSPLQNGSYRFQPRQSATFPLSPGSDYAVADDTDENGDSLSDIGRTMAQGVVSSTASSSTNLLAMAENRHLEGLKRSQWQSSLGFGIIEEGSQSRRHSFAELPTRSRNSPIATQSDLAQSNQYQGYGAVPRGFAPMHDSNDPFQRESVADERESPNFPTFNPHQQLFYQALVRLQKREEETIVNAQTNDRSYAASYFSGIEAQRRHIREPPIDDYNPFAVPNVFNSRPSKILYLVAFKCNRADIYYIPENTGLQVKIGDTVIVEGDRGQDLGTVEQVNITMEQAKQFKEEYTQKHFRCLMMFSRLYPHIAALAGDDQAFANSLAGHGPGNPLQGMPGNNFNQDAASQFETEPRPKMIKRVARPDEVHLLREKEGNEAKAKRVCQTKVNDHGLRMEILDAEFQHDYRKLTFFYYAEEYINFNELVTDLFKVYKTRIWMSAINPSTYMAMNPNTAPRPSQFQKSGGQGHAANYLRSQEEYRTAIENGRTSSPPVDRDGPAARGNREFERVMQIQNARLGAHTNTAPTDSSSAMLSGTSREAPTQTFFDPRRNNHFHPNGQFVPFTHQYGPTVPANGSWPHNTNTGAYPFAYPNVRDLTGNYSVSPIGAMPHLNQQANAFTPRGALHQQHFPASNYSHNAEQQDIQKLLNDQLQRFSIDPARRA